MDITHLGHAAVLVETPTERVLIDPGNFSTRWHQLTDVTAVLVTHQHPDHIDPEHVPALLAANPTARVLVEPSVAPIVGERAEPIMNGAHVSIGSLGIQAVGEHHAVIHKDLPVLGNVGFVISESQGPTFFHPGDSLATIPGGIDIVATPAYGPWAAVKETIEFVRSVGARQGFLIHDGLLNERGWALIAGRMDAMTDTEFHDLRHCDPVTFTQ